MGIMGLGTVSGFEHHAHTAPVIHGVRVCVGMQQGKSTQSF